MRTIVRSIGSLLAAGVLVAACGASATPSPVATSAPPASIAPTSATTPAPASQPDPTSTPVASVEPMSPAYVTGTETFTGTTGSTMTEGGVTRLRDILVTATDTLDDPRVSGTWTAHLSADVMGTTGFEWGKSEMANAGGSWAATCAGGVWADGDGSDLACWAVGSGGYQGLTYYLHIRTSGTTAEITGVILPLPAPKQ